MEEGQGGLVEFGLERSHGGGGGGGSADGLRL